MIIIQAKDLEPFLKWLETCPCSYNLTSMQGGYVHVKFNLTQVSATINPEDWKNISNFQGDAEVK